MPVVHTRVHNPPFPIWLWLLPCVLLPLAGSGPNTVLALYSIAVLAVGIRLLWRPGEPPVLLFIFLYQWMQSATGALYANFLGSRLEDLRDGYQTAAIGASTTASALMLTGTLVLAIAMRLGAGKPSAGLYDRVKAFATSRPFGFWLRLYGATWLFSTLCTSVAPSAGGWQVPLLTLGGLKWASFVLLTFAAFMNSWSYGRTIWVLVFLGEFVLSIGGYFSTFKEVFFFSLFGLATARVRFNPRLVISGSLFAVLMLGLGIVWTAIKVDYREFVSAGSGQQVVVVEYGERLDALGELISKLDGKDLSDATDQFLRRLMYHQFFGVVVNRVPSLIPHSTGEIWSEAISRPFMPRVLFPEKRAINDSDLTNQYTGLRVATAEEGVSISLGYMAESYIDFGAFLMFIAIGMLGAGIGLLYRWLLKQQGQLAAVGAALTPFALMPAHLAETSILKLIPSLILTFLVCVLWLKLLTTIVASTRPFLVRKSVRP